MGNIGNKLLGTLNLASGGVALWAPQGRYFALNRLAPFVLISPLEWGFPLGILRFWVGR